jgi:hypothetical protein
MANSQYSQQQIDGAKHNAKLHGFNPASISNDLAVQFLDWWFSNKETLDCYVPPLQRSFWQKHLNVQGKVND